MHDYGVSSPEAKKIIESISQNLMALYENVEDTLFIITADHGQVDITDYVSLYEDEVLMNMLEIYPFLEARAPAFLVIGDKAGLLGDYIAVGTYTHKQALLTPVSTKFKGHHTSLTEEMEVPLILLSKI